MFLESKFSGKTAIKFQKCFCVTCFRNLSVTIIWNNLCLFNHKRVKRNFEFRKKTYFKKHLLINVQQNILPRTMQQLRDATNASEQDDSFLDKGLNNFFLNYNSCDFFSVQDSCSYVCN